MSKAWLIAAVGLMAAGPVAVTLAQQNTCECGKNPPPPPRDRIVEPYAGEPADLSRTPNDVVAFFLVQFVTPPAEEAGCQETQAFPGVPEPAGEDVSLADDHAGGLGGVAAQVVRPA